jgi:hypothetical protein
MSTKKLSWEKEARDDLGLVNESLGSDPELRLGCALHSKPQIITTCSCKSLHDKCNHNSKAIAPEHMSEVINLDAARYK